MIKAILIGTAVCFTSTMCQPSLVNWKLANFNDGSWESVRVLGDLGTGVWTGPLTTEGPAAGLPSAAKWIWKPPISYSNSPTPAEVWYFRKSFILPVNKTVLSAKLIMTADNIFVAYLNGIELGTSPDWQTFSVIDAKSGLKNDSNILAVSVENTAPGDAGLIGALVIKFTDGSSLDVSTGLGWKMVLVSHPPELLWENGAPGAKGTADADKPTITPYLPDPNLATGVAVIICPGGGYVELSMDVEGSQMAKWYNSLGITAFVVKSRVSPYMHPYPLMDAKRAMRWVRANWHRFNLDTTRIGIQGTSAGGHLASSLATLSDNGDKTRPDPIDRQKSKGDFLVIGYAVITMELPLTHLGSRNALLGPNPSQIMIDSLSTHKHVTSKTPFTFLFHGDLPDDGVPIGNAYLFLKALQDSGVDGKLHIDVGKPHGYGLNSDWPADCIAFFERHGLLKKMVVKTRPIQISKQSLFTWSDRKIILSNSARGPLTLIDIQGNKVPIASVGKNKYQILNSIPGIYIIKIGHRAEKIIVN